jgi:hypothetical protein
MTKSSPSGLAEVLENGANAVPSTLSMVLVLEVKGQLRRVPETAMAFDHRDVGFEMSIIANWTEPAQDAANVDWARVERCPAYVLPHSVDLRRRVLLETAKLP